MAPPGRISDHAGTLKGGGGAVACVRACVRARTHVCACFSSGHNIKCPASNNKNVKGVILEKNVAARLPTQISVCPLWQCMPTVGKEKMNSVQKGSFISVD